ncbi:tetraspanin-8-like [Trifolium pratense]|uniref:tetraspanin-8-like n=1 Tax=Trifolium pratense TaxID=57577 RepID=UPI001E69667E|nr:tetraspanin-8-like [Trifolium pratense]
MKFSNILIGILNFVTLIMSIPILVLGVWVTKNYHSECDTWAAKFIISLSVFQLVVSLTGFIGACCRVSWFLRFYLIVMLFPIILVFSFTIFAFVVTNKGAGETLPNKGYKEYRLGGYSNWLQNRVNNNNNWNTIKSCFQSQQLCSNFYYQFANDAVDKF